MLTISRAYRYIATATTLALSLGLGVAGPAHGEELIVSAAASLTNAFKEVGAGFEKNHPDAKVVFNFSASGALLQQIENGAPVDVFASADQQSMDQGEAKKLMKGGSRRDFVSNKLVLIQPKKSTLTVTGLADLAQPGVLRIAVCNPATVPAGRYARDVLSGAKLWEALTPRFIYADTVRQALDYVSRGEVDAGFVFATDAAIASDKVRVVSELVSTMPLVYPIAVLEASKHQKLAASFVAYVLAPQGQAVLARYGFGKP